MNGFCIYTIVCEARALYWPVRPVFVHAFLLFDVHRENVRKRGVLVQHVHTTMSCTFQMISGRTIFISLNLAKRNVFWNKQNVINLIYWCNPATQDRPLRPIDFCSFRNKIRLTFYAIYLWIWRSPAHLKKTQGSVTCRELKNLDRTINMIQ